MEEVKKTAQKKTSNTSKVRKVSKRKIPVSDLSSDELMEQILAKKKNKTINNTHEKKSGSINKNSSGKNNGFSKKVNDFNEELSNGIIDDPKGKNEGVAPYVISEEEFGEMEDYDQKTLFWYYRDNILATDEDLEVEDKFTTIGDALEEFEKDRYLERVLVRNEQDETDYEILVSDKHFYEVTGGDTE